MAEIRTVTTLRRKRDEVRKAVRKYERCLDQARADLTHLIAAIAIFEAKGGDESLPAYADLHRLFRYGDMMVVADLCPAHTAKKFLGPIRASAVEAVSLFMIDPLHLVTLVQFIP
jgi:hypothetical protein